MFADLITARWFVPLLAALLATGLTGCPAGEGTDSGTPLVNQCGYSGGDSDGDGLPDAVEDINGDGLVGVGECDPFNADTDGDGLIDSVEVGCDGLGKPGVDTFCWDPDSDGDGVYDGVEDSNGDGIYSPELGETDPTAADSDGDGCDDGEEFMIGTDPTSPDTDGDGLPDGQEDFNCDGVIDPTNGETDPMLQDTDGDGVPDNLEPTFICVDPGKFGIGGRRPVQFYEQDLGDFRVGLETASTEEARTVTYAELSIQGLTAPGEVRAGAFWEYTENHPSGLSELAGFVVSLPTDTNFDGVPDTQMFDEISARDRILALIDTVFGPMANAITPRSGGNVITSWEGFGAVVNVVVQIDLLANSDLAAMRATLLPALFGVSASDLTNLTTSFGDPTSSFILSVEVLFRAPPDVAIDFPGRVMVMGGVVATGAYDDPSNVSSIRLSDLANGTGLAQFGDSDANECDPFDVVSLPVADIIWVIDDSGSTNSYRTDIKDNAVDLFDRATAAGLDFRMGVISMGPNAGPGGSGEGFICDPPIGATVPGLGASCSSATPVPPNYNAQSTDGRWISPFERDAFGWCICHPPNGDGGTEYGLENGRVAVMGSLPRDSGNPRKIRPEATLVVIYVGDETAQGPGYSLNMGDTVPGAPNYNMYIQPHMDLFNGIANPLNVYPPGADPSMSIGRAHGIVRIVGGTCSSNAAFGYEQVVNGVGGVLGSVCAGSLGPSLQTIIDDIIGQASPLELERTPISLSLACAINDVEAERSRTLGFDYSASSNSIIFFGLGMMLENAPDVACSYKYPIDDSPYEEGTPGIPIK